jgi:hypothetical protein
LPITMEESEDRAGDAAIFGDVTLPTDSSRVSGDGELGSVNDLKPRCFYKRYLRSISLLF